MKQTGTSKMNDDSITWVCTDCGQEVPPYSVVSPTRDKMILMRRQYCTCEGGKAREQADIKRLFDFQMTKRWRDSHLPEGITFETIDKTRQAQAIVSLRNYWKALSESANENWCALWGHGGTGKTTLAVAFGHQVQEAYGLDGRVYFCNWEEHIKRLQLSWNDRTSGEAMTDEVELMQQVQFLILDDLDRMPLSGSKGNGGWAVQQLYSVLNPRDRAGLPTMLTMMMSPTTMIKNLQTHHTDAGTLNTVEAISIRLKRRIGVSIQMK